jgi:hypothetical protein
MKSGNMNSTKQRRKPIVAALLTFIAPGLGSLALSVQPLGVMHLKNLEIVLQLFTDEES